MKTQKPSSFDCLGMPLIISPKWQAAQSAGQLTINQEDLNQEIKKKFNNIYVRNSKVNPNNLLETDNNNEFIQPGEKYKKSHFLLMDFSGLEAHKNQERKGFLDRKHRKKMILPHLSYSYKKEAETQDKSLPKHKFDDLMIDIYKNQKGKQMFPRDRSLPFDKSTTPGIKKQGDIEQKIRTEPSSSKSFKLQFEDRYRKKIKGPRVIESEILKHSTNLNIIRKKMFSQNRGRQPIQNRFNIQSSENQRLRSFNNIPHQAKQEIKEVQLLTFYPKQPKQTEDEINQFLQDMKDQSPSQKQQLYKFHFS